MVLAGRVFAAGPLVDAPHPEGLARGCVDGYDVAPCTGRRVEDSVDHQRRHLGVDLGARTEVGGAPAPLDLQIGDVVPVDLIQRGVPGAAGVAAVVMPLAVGRSRLPHNRGRQRQHQSQRCGPQTESSASWWHGPSWLTTQKNEPEPVSVLIGSNHRSRAALAPAPIDGEDDPRAVASQEDVS